MPSFLRAKDSVRSRFRLCRPRPVVDPGGQIMNHGLPTNWSAKDVGHPKIDWTQGCIALTNREMDEIWKKVSDGPNIEIHP